MKWIPIFLLLLPVSVSGQGNQLCDSNYPTDAAQEGTEGFVQLAYDVSATGVPINITVIKSYPAHVFDAAAICALSKWRYTPSFREGEAVAQTDLKVQLDFALEKQSN